MINKKLAKIFFEIAEYLEMEGTAFKPYAYQRAAITLQTINEDVAEIYKKEGLEGLKKIPGVGESIALKIEEYIKTGKIRYYEELKQKMPVDLSEIVAVEGMGPKRAKVLYEKLGIKTLKDLERAAREHKIAPLFGFGEKTEKNILQAIEFLKKSHGRFLLGEILPQVREIMANLKKLKEIETIAIAGSLRRKKETIGDVDLLVISSAPLKVMDFFVHLPGIEKIWGKGETKSSVRMKEGFDIDLRVLPKHSYGAGLQYFTGSKAHNIVLRKIAIEKRFKLSEYGLFKGKKKIAGQTEEEIYHVLGMDWIPPEMRENRGEIKLALSHSLPRIIEYDEIRGDLHCHSNWDGGANSIEEMAERAIEMGYEYLGISDHTKYLRIERGLDEKTLLKQNREIARLNRAFARKGINFRLLHGCEANILKDGRIDIDNKVLEKLDFVIAGIHSHFKMKKREMTARLIKAIENPYVDIISHPTGRILKRRDEYEIDFDRILKAAKKHKKILEINSYPERLDLNDINIKKAKEMGVKMIINTDAHHRDQLRFIEFGIAQARRGWAEKKDIINTLSYPKLIQIFR